MDLKKTVLSIFSENEKRSNNGLQSDRNVQGHFSRSYKSRFFLELLQNARDAIVQAKRTEGKVKAWLENGVFYFANNGADFDEDGVNGICYPAISYKKGMEMVGHKGIGFNAVLEISDCPEIITRHGTFYFSYSSTSEKTGKQPDKIPLFQFPHYREETIQDTFPELVKNGFTTVVKLPLTKRLSESDVREQIMQVTGQDLIFLQAITELQLENEIKKIDKKEDNVTLTESGSIKHYKLYHCDINFAPESIAEFDDDEKEHFVSTPKAECKFLLQVDHAGKFIPAVDAPLFLFYGLDIKSGFSFYIHSYFSVTLDRKRLADKSPLNKKLLECIAEYFANEFLKAVMRDFPKNELSVIVYDRKANANLELLYDSIPKTLSDKSFIYHPQSDQHLMPSQVLLVDEKIMRLFNNGILGDKYLLYVPDVNIHNWLSKEVKVPYIKNEQIISHIEQKCFENITNPKFFELLYDVIAERNLDLRNKKVLLTEHGQLVAGNETELYYQRKASYVVPAELDQSLAFLHKGIKVDDLRESSKKLLGLKEYSEENLYRAALRVFEQFQPLSKEENQTIGIGIIRFLKSMGITNEISISEISDRIMLPVIHNLDKRSDWKEPLTTPIYYKDFPFKNEYNNDYCYVDLETLVVDYDIEGWKFFLSKLGVWSIPGAFINVNPVIATIGNNAISINNNRVLHQPNNEITDTFGNAIISNWRQYRDFITTENRGSKAIRVSNKKVIDSEKIRHSELYNFLSSHKWIVATYQGETILCQPDEVIGMASIEAGKNPNQIISQYIPVAKLDTRINSDFISDFNVIHASAENIENYKRLLKLVHRKYLDLNISDKNGFEKFFNRILTFVHDYLQSLEEIQRNKKRDELREEYFLTKSIQDGTLRWSVGSRSIHIDDKAFLDGLETRIIGLIPDPYSFTKRDRNEWGKFGAKIGRPLSGIINTSVVSVGEPHRLVKEIDCFEVMIAFVEDDIEKHLTDEQIEQLASVNLFVHNELRLLLTIEGKQAELNQLFYADRSKANAILHMDRSLFNDSNNKTRSKAFADFFERFTDVEIKRLDVIIDGILKLVGKQAKYEYATSRNIDENRLEAIRSILLEGIGGDPEMKSPEEIKAPITPGTQVLITTSTTTLPTTQTEVTLKVALEDYLSVLDSATGDPITFFSGNGIPPSNGNGGTNGGSSYGFGGAGTELNDPSKKMVGFLAEYYIYKRIQEGNADILAHFGCSVLQAQNIKWFNKARLTNPELRDQSVGKGCDMMIEELGVHIEVKGMIHDSPIISVTGPEFDKMREISENYYLIIVSNLFTEGMRSTTVIRNPHLQVYNGMIRLNEAKMFTP